MLTLGIVQTSLTSALAQPHLSSFLIFIDWVSSLTPLTPNSSHPHQVVHRLHLAHDARQAFLQLGDEIV